MSDQPSVNPIDNILLCKPIPVEQISSSETVTSSVNTGVVQLKCVINGSCPFNYNNFVDNLLIFNSQSLSQYPESVRNALSSDVGSEGIYLNPEYQYRNTYIAAPIQQSSSPQYLDKLSVPSLIPSTIYERYQRFIVTPTVFDSSFLAPSQYQAYSSSSSYSCESKAMWEYEYNIPVDGKVSGDTGGNYVLMPKMISGVSCSNYGVHWRLEKQTPLFRGEDFFITFNKRAKSVDVPTGIYDTKINNIYNKIYTLNNNANYSALDPLYNQANFIFVNGQITNIKQPCNLGVVKYSVDKNNQFTATNTKTYDFRDQAYYVIEMGIGTADSNYFIIITQRGNPIFVRCEGGLSYLLSEFKNNIVEQNRKQNTSQVSGNILISSDWFKVTVRNHLNNIHIYFEGDGFKTDPWIIERIDMRYGGSTASTERPSQQKKLLQVPAGPMAIWGGNQKSSFSFGILQYQTGEMPSTNNTTSYTQAYKSSPVSFLLQNTKNKSYLGLSNNSNGSVASNYVDFFSLPYNENLYFSFRTGTYPLPGITQSSFFAQDAQEFKEAYAQPQANSMIIGNAQVGNYLQTNKTLKDTDPANIALSEISLIGTNIQNDVDTNCVIFKQAVTLRAGGYTFLTNNTGSAPQYYDGDPNYIWFVQDCITPIFTTLRLYSSSQNTQRWTPKATDVSSNVIEYSDSWSAQDFFKMEHTGNIKFLISRGISINGDQSDFLANLINKAFYIEVWARYQPAINSSQDGGGSQNVNYSQINDYVKLFTGLCFGGSIEISMQKNILNCQIFDYAKILEGSLIFNSPVFDGFRDIDAVYELLSMVGFAYTKKTDPLILIKEFAATTGQQMRYVIGLDGRISPVAIYALPNAYDQYQSPYFKFNDASKIYDAILTLGKKGGKCFFFDSYGIAHFESYFDFNVVSSLKKSTIASAQPPDCIDNTIPTNSLALWYFTTEPNNFPGQAIFNSTTYQFSVQDVINDVKLFTTDPNRQLLMSEEINYSSIYNVNDPNFLGYTKTFFEKDGIFGSEKSAQSIMEFYKTMQQAPLHWKFETYGLPLRALDVVVINQQPLRIMKADTTINIKENKWWSSVEAEWMFNNQSSNATVVNNVVQADIQPPSQ